MGILDTNIQKHISVFIKSQFPLTYQSEGPVFVSFVQAYYEWLESEQGLPVYDARRILDYQDVDTTVQAFKSHFKTTYLPSIQLGTKTDFKQLVKHSLDLYRSRGTPRAVDLLFRLVFGVGANVYFPSQDLFKLSAGKWTKPVYLEVAIQQDADQFVGLDIFGLHSGAIGFVERVVRRQAPSGLIIDTLYLSPVQGNFQTGELIQAVDNPVSIDLCPIVIGSLNDLIVVEGGADFANGDIVSVTGSLNGYDGRAIVAKTSSLAGLVDFNLVDGGYGYSANALVLVSQKVFILDQIVVGSNTDGESYFVLFDNLTQPQADLNYENASGDFSNNDQLTTYFANGSVKGTGTVLEVTASSPTAGVLFVANVSGDLDEPAIYNGSNAVTANLAVVNGYFDITASANVISDGRFVTSTLALSNIVGTFVLGETVTQPSTNVQFQVVLYTRGSGSTGTIQKTDISGVINNSIQILGGTSGATANIISQSFQVGVISVNNTFTTDARAPVLGSVSGTTAIIETIGTGSSATFNVGTLSYTEDLLLSNDFILAYSSTPLNSTGYGFPAFSTANVNTLLITALSYANVTIGRIATLSGQNPGENYTAPPLIRIFEPLVYPYLRQNEQLTFSGASRSFQVGEEIIQSDSDARGLVLTNPVSNTSTLFLQRLNVFDTFEVTSNSSTTIAGVSTGATANVTQVDVEPYYGPTDISGQFIGVDAVIRANVATANGSATDLTIIDSGFGFQQGELCTFTRSDGNFGTAQAILEKQGTGNGYYEDTNGFPSDIKKLFDGFYWQNFSYEVRSPLSIDKYADMLERLLHVSGTQSFGAVYQHRTKNESLGGNSSFAANLTSSNVTSSAQQYLVLGVP